MNPTRNQPYVYKLVNKTTNEYYIGYRKNNKYPAEIDLGTYYFSSSKYINKTNFDQYQIYILEKFDDSNCAYTFEQRLIFENWDDPLLLNKSCFHGKKMFVNLPGYTMSENFKKNRSIQTKGKNNPMYGKSQPEYIKIKHSERMKGSVPHNQGKTYEETYGAEKADILKERLRQINLEKKVPVVLVECPHCKKVGNKIPMARWHFENCKFKS